MAKGKGTPEAVKEFKEKIKRRVESIYLATYQKELHRGFSSFKKEDSLYSKCGAALVKLNYIVNCSENTNNPRYTWAKSYEPSTLVDEVYKEIKQNHTMKKEEKNNTAAVLPVKVDSAEKPVLTVTDEELWNELKARGYSIQDNRLCKITYLQ